MDSANFRVRLRREEREEVVGSLTFGPKIAYKWLPDFANAIAVPETEP